MLVALVTLFTPSAALAVAQCPVSIDFTGAAVNDTRTLNVSTCSEAIRGGLYLALGVDSQNYWPLTQDAAHYYNQTPGVPSTVSFSNGAQIQITPVYNSTTSLIDTYQFKLLKLATSAGNGSLTLYYASTSCPVSGTCPLAIQNGYLLGVTDTSKIISVVMSVAPLAATTTSVTSSGAITVGNNVTYTAVVSGTGSPTGTVAFKDGGNSITGCTAVALSGGTAQCTTAPAGVGTHTITAVYSGDSGNSGSTSNSYSQVVTAVPPAVTNVSPNSGPTTGGTLVTITGTGFTGLNGVYFGTTPATSYTLVSATQITATAPFSTAGPVDITVTSASGLSTTSASDQFTYVFAPVISSVGPAAGPLAGGTVVTIFGGNLSGATAVKFGTNAATSFTVVSATQINATAPAGTAGTVDITVTTVGGTSATSANDQYTYAATPVVTAISPSSGPAAGGTVVTITGTDFTGATTVRFGNSTASAFTVVSATQITATAPSRPAGTVDITVRSAGGGSATSASDQFTYIAVPTIASVSPSTGPLAGGTVVTINGTGFTGASAVKFGANDATAFTVVSATQITATAPAGTAGTVDITVTTTGGTSATSANDRFSYVATPVVTAISPATGPLVGGTVVTISGTGFTGASAVKFGATDATAFTVVSATSITATAPAGTAGTVDITVTTTGGTSTTSASDQFSYVATPVVTAISPTSGPLIGGTVVTISGTGFTGASAVKFGANAAASFTVVNATQITATAPAGTAGTVDVTVTTPGGTSTTTASDQFTYFAPPIMRTWVSGTGNDANACTRSAPCLTFAGAFARTLAGGEINCLDGGDYGPVTITYAVAIVCDRAGAHVRVGGTDGITVNAGPTDTVRLSGLDISADPGAAPVSGIKLLSAGALSITNTQLRGFAGAGYAIAVVPTAPLVAVQLDRVSVVGVASASTGGMLVSPAAGGSVRVAILRSRFDGSAGTGVRFDTVGKTGATIAAEIQNSLFTASNVALLAKAPGGTGSISLTVLGTSFSRNSYGASINGTVSALFGDSAFASNGTAIMTLGGATVRSAGGNEFALNTVDGAFASTAPRR